MNWLILILAVCMEVAFTFWRCFFLTTLTGSIIGLKLA